VENPETIASDPIADSAISESPFTLSKDDGAKAELAPKPIATEYGTEVAQESLWGFMILAFLAGLAALLTPCVFPMIPMTGQLFYRSGK